MTSQSRYSTAVQVTLDGQDGRDEIAQAIREHLGAEWPVDGNHRLTSLMLLFDDDGEETPALPAETSASSDERDGVKVELQAFRLTTIIRPNEVAGHLIVTPPDGGEMLVLGLSLYRYLTMHAMAERAVIAAKGAVENPVQKRALCTRHDFEAVFDRFADAQNHPDCMSKPALDIVRFIGLVRGQLADGRYSGLIKGRLNSGFYFDTHPANVTLVPPPEPWFPEI